MSRYELKYVVPNRLESALTNAIFQHPLSFNKTYEDRWINNIYFDTPSFRSWRENLNGSPNRSKFRLRWYGEGPQIVNSTLENKLKEKEMGSKRYHHFTEVFEKHQLPIIEAEINQYSQSELHLVAVLYNRYQRSYYESMNGQFRLTVDRHLVFADPDKILEEHTYLRHESIIVELKFDKDRMAEYNDFTPYFPFRQSKFSKFSVGLETILPT